MLKGILSQCYFSHVKLLWWKRSGSIFLIVIRNNLSSEIKSCLRYSLHISILSYVRLFFFFSSWCHRSAEFGSDVDTVVLKTTHYMKPSPAFSNLKNKPSFSLHRSRLCQRHLSQEEITEAVLLYLAWPRTTCLLPCSIRHQLSTSEKAGAPNMLHCRNNHPLSIHINLQCSKVLLLHWNNWKSLPEGSVIIPCGLIIYYHAPIPCPVPLCCISYQAYHKLYDALREGGVCVYVKA